jgi:hypothetical protein
METEKVIELGTVSEDTAGVIGVLEYGHSPTAGPPPFA